MSKLSAKNLLVSVIVPTKNSEATIRECLESIRNQTYPHIEVLVVDNHSSDGTVTIARKLDSPTYIKGPERSAQRNFGASKSHGKYLLFVDSDMIAPKNLIYDCVKISENEDADAVLIGHSSTGNGYWTKCRCLESLFYQTKEFYLPRFFRHESFMASGGFDVTLNASEDIDVYLRFINSGFKIALSKVELIHLEKDNTSLTDLLRKNLWAMPYVSKYLDKRKKYKAKLSGVRFPLSFLRKAYLLGKDPKHIPGFFLLKMIDYLTVVLSWII